MPAHLAAGALAFALLTVPASGAVVAYPERDEASSTREVFAVRDGVETVEDRDVESGFADATLTAALPAGVALVGATLLGLGLIRRRS
jgi:hypothetical protein